LINLVIWVGKGKDEGKRILYNLKTQEKDPREVKGRHLVMGGRARFQGELQQIANGQGKY